MARRLTASQAENALVERFGVRRETAYVMVYQAWLYGRFRDTDGEFTVRHFRRGNSYVVAAGREQQS
jgi:hypothetical protein